jgi:hypothetical protein
MICYLSKQSITSRPLTYKQAIFCSSQLPNRVPLNPARSSFIRHSTTARSNTHISDRPKPPHTTPSHTTPHTTQEQCPPPHPIQQPSTSPPSSPSPSSPSSPSATSSSRPRHPLHPTALPPPLQAEDESQQIESSRSWSCSRSCNAGTSSGILVGMGRVLRVRRRGC